MLSGKIGFGCLQTFPGHLMNGSMEMGVANGRQGGWGGDRGPTPCPHWKVWKFLQTWVLLFLFWSSTSLSHSHFLFPPPLSAMTWVFQRILKTTSIFRDACSWRRPALMSSGGSPCRSLQSLESQDTPNLMLWPGCQPGSGERAGLPREGLGWSHMFVSWGILFQGAGTLVLWECLKIEVSGLGLYLYWQRIQVGKVTGWPITWQCPQSPHSMLFRYTNILYLFIIQHISLVWIVSRWWELTCCSIPF